MVNILKVNKADYKFIKELLKNNCLATVYEETYYRFFKEEVEYNYKYNTIECLVNRIYSGKNFENCLDKYVK